MSDREQAVEAARNALRKRWTTSPDGRRTDLEVPGIGTVIKGGRVQSRAGVRLDSKDDGVELTVAAASGEALTMNLYREKSRLLDVRDDVRDLVAGVLRPFDRMLEEIDNFLTTMDHWS